MDLTRRDFLKGLGVVGASFALSGPLIDAALKLGDPKLNFVEKILVTHAKRSLPPRTPYDLRVLLPRDYGRMSAVAWYASTPKGEYGSAIQISYDAMKDLKFLGYHMDQNVGMSTKEMTT